MKNKKQNLIYAPNLKIERINPAFIKHLAELELKRLSKLLLRAGLKLNYEIVENKRELRLL